MKNVKQINAKHMIKFFLVPCVLLSVWLGLTFLYISKFDTSFSVLSYNHAKQYFDKGQTEKLLKGDKIRGHFIAEENNLGIVSLRFKTFIRPLYKNEDTLVFRIKEKGAKEWYYENEYKNGLIYDVPVFPFGFPKITDSKGKKYIFEVESLHGNKNNAVALSDKNQILFSRYQIPKSEILQDKGHFIIYIIKKFRSGILNTDVKFSSFVYFLPFIFYLLWIAPFGVSQKRKILNFVVKTIVSKFYFLILGVVLTDIFFIQLTNDIVYLVILFLWITTLHINKRESNMTFFVVFCLLLIVPIFLLVDDSQTAEKAAAWAYMFLVAGLIQIFYELKKGVQVKNKRTKN